MNLPSRSGRTHPKVACFRVEVAKNYGSVWQGLWPEATMGGGGRRRRRVIRRVVCGGGRLVVVARAAARKDRQW